MFPIQITKEYYDIILICANVPESVEWNFSGNKILVPDKCKCL